MADKIKTVIMTPYCSGNRETDLYGIHSYALPIKVLELYLENNKNYGKFGSL